MPINAGDAVFHFLGDTTNLDQAYQRVNSGTAAAVAPAKEQVTQLGNEFIKTGAKAQEGAVEAVAAVEEVGFSAQEAKGEIALLGEELGVKIPRHIRGFITEIPGVGKALEAAFSATAALILIQVLVEGAQKLTEFVSETFIFTESMKEADKANTAFNQKVVEHNKKMKELTETYQNLFRTGPEKLAHDVTNLTEELAKLNKQLDAQKEAVHKVTTELTFWEKAQVAIGNNVSGLGFLATRVFDNLAERQEAASHAAELAAQTTKEQIQEVEKQRQIAAKQASEALKKQEHDNAEAATASIIRFTQQFNAAKKLRDLLATPAPDFIAKATVDLAQFNSLLNGPGSVEDGVKKLEKAFDSLGISTQTEFRLLGQVAQEKAAVKTLHDLGASTRDLTRAKIALINTEIKLAAAQGHSTVQMQREVNVLKTQLDPALKNHSKVAESAANDVGRSILSEAYAWGQGAATIGQAARQITATIIQEIAKQAEVRGAAKLAEAIGEAFHNPSAAAADFASAAAWFALAGGVSAVAGAVSGGPSGPTGSVNNPVSTVPAATSPAEAPGRAPVVVAQSFATGGLVSGPTLAVIGDSVKRSSGGQEAAIPLDDPQAVSSIVKALGGGGTHIHIKGDVVDHNQLMRKLSHQVKQGRGRLVANDSFKTTRRA